MNYVIIGNSAAAAGCIEGIRRTDKDGLITVISSENHHIYSRPLISYLLLGKTDLERMKYRDDNFYAHNACKVILGKTVTAINSSDKKIVLDDGQTVNYDKLLVSTGSAPFVPPFEGLDTVPVKHTFMSLDDALALQKDLSKNKEVLIVGAGLIGLKCAEGISKSVKKITVVDLSPKILSSILDDEGAKRVQKHLESKNVEFKLGTSVKSFNKNNAVLDNGENIKYDILVLAVGVRPNISLLKNIGAETDRGILTDSKMQTSIDSIYSAGDCTESFDISADKSRILALLPNAYAQGECAGVNMAGGEMQYDNAIPMNAIGFFGLHIITAGTYDGEVYESLTEKQYKKLFYKDNLLKGYILIGNVEKAGIYTALIKNKVPLDSIDFKLICEKPGLMAFSKKYRDEKLGGVLVEH